MTLEKVNIYKQGRGIKSKDVKKETNYSGLFKDSCKMAPIQIARLDGVGLPDRKNSWISNVSRKLLLCEWGRWWLIIIKICFRFQS